MAGSPTPSVAVQRLRLGAVCLVITLLVFTQSSALIAADTKFDLVVRPWHFLVTAASAWDPTSDAGTLQNQAYGYLFPMGPFFVLGHLMQLPPWIIQRWVEPWNCSGTFTPHLRSAAPRGRPHWRRSPKGSPSHATTGPDPSVGWTPRATANG